jgi:hypothetical protein
MSVVDEIIKTAQSGRAATTYKVGSKSGNKGLPIDVQLSIDQDFKKTIFKGVAIFSGGVALGIAAGFIITKSK